MWSLSTILSLLVFRYAPIIAWLVAALLLVRPAKLKPAWTCIALVALGAMLARSLWFQLLGGHPYYPDIPENVCNFFGWCYSFGMILAGLSLLPPYRWWRARAAVCMVLAVVLASWGCYEVLKLPAVNNYEVKVSGLPPSFDGIRLVHVSDIHCSPSSRRSYVQGIVDRVNAAKPDIVCMTGDFVDGSPESRLADLEPLADIRSRWGVYGCTGNHEFYYTGYRIWRPYFIGLGIRMLDNAHEIITNGTDKLAIGGVIDPVGMMKPMNGTRHWPAPDVERAFAGAPPAACRILLSHRPINLEENAKHGVKLQLSGHTHGGVIKGIAWLPVAALNDWHVNGFYREGDLILYVTPGAGQWAGYHLRLGVPSEIAVFTLRCAK